jgi:hypothetical protein
MSHSPKPTAAHLGRTLVALLVTALAGTAPAAWTAPATPLDQAFVRPPDSAKPQVWWHWQNGNITAEGITLDLEAMKRVGIGGAQIFDVAPGIPAGRVNYMSPEWRAMIKHAVSEADRLGLELCIHNGAGWSSSGGPWITPEYAMQMVVTSEQKATGPARFDAVLPQPMTRHGYYRDIAILAFPSPAAEAAAPSATVTCSVPGVDVSPLSDGNPDTQMVLPLRGLNKPQYIQWEFPQSVTVRSLSFVPGGGRNGTPGELQVSEDGVTFNKAADFGVPEAELTRSPVNINFPPVTGRFYRLVFVRTSVQSSAVVLAEAHLESSFRISNLAAKGGWVRGDNPQPDNAEVPAEALIDRRQIVDITNKMSADGRLTWDVPAGTWTILRVGYTPTGVTNHPAPEPGLGLECDKLSAEAAEVHFAGMLGKIIGDLGPLAGKTLKDVLIDSYEVGCCNWTPKFRAEFAKRRGYDPVLYLPVMTGRVVESLDVSERFLWDMRRTIADLFSENYYGKMAALCHQHGLILSAEPYGDGGFDTMQAGSKLDIPMSEFWTGGGTDNQCAKMVASAAHTFGRRVVGAESFTAGGQRAWLDHPYSLKALGDEVYCGGVNRFIFHSDPQQPWVDLVPGMTMGPFGTEFGRTETWWNQSAAWMQYLARCQYLLQSGLFVGDLCYFCGEGAPNDLPARQGLRPPPPSGYDYDGCDADAIMTRMSVKDGKLALPDGMSYRVLVLPEQQTMTPALLRKIRDLVQAGATVVGPKPLRSASLQGFPDCDREVQALAQELWGPCDGKAVTEHPFGKGMVAWGKPLQDVLSARGVKPDFEFTGLGKKADISYIHRSVDGTDVYFVSNQKPRSDAVQCTFRAGGKIPELWYPDSGKIEQAPVYSEKDGRIVVPVRFGPAGSVFVVFRKAGHPDEVVAVRRDGNSVFVPKPQAVPKVEIRKVIYGVLTEEQPSVVDVTAKVAAMVRDGALTVQADNSLAGDPAPNLVKQMRVDYTYNGKPYTKTVDENATLTLPDDTSRDPSGKPGVLEIRKALYGLPQEADEAQGQRFVDLTEKVARMVKDGTVSIPATNDFAGGDPASMVVKQLRVDYTLDGRPYSRTIGENQTIDIPDGTENEGAYAEEPSPEITVGADGALQVTAWERGIYEATTAAGKRLRARVGAVPAPVAIEGSWELSFPPKLGAPDKIALPKLISWTDSDNAGVKYFSGAATYVKDFDVPASAIGPGKAVRLELGNVREIAEIRLNGRDLGILWKPPFQADVTGIVKAGTNHLEVRVTNLWVNRLIGDEQLPDDAEWNGDGSLRAWPTWLLEGKPRPQTGRITFATWKHYSKDSPLLDSGLIGPVKLRCGVVAKLSGA